MSTKPTHWTQRKTGVIGVGTGTTLTLDQQRILEPVTRYKKEWVRPSSLKPGQNPNFKISKWVIDTTQPDSTASTEEMQQALEAVTSGAVTLPSTSTSTSSATPAQPQPPAAPADPNATISLFGSPAPAPAPVPTPPTATSAAAPPTPAATAAAAAMVQPLTAAQIEAARDPVRAVMQGETMVGVE